MLGVVISTQVVLYVLFGGSGTLIGAVIGAIDHRRRQLLAVGQLPGHLADHSRRAAAAGDPVPAARPDQPRARRARARRQLSAGRRRRSRAWRSLRPPASSRVFGKLTALDGAALTVAENEFHGLIGPNGSGKSTLMKCVAGAEMPTQGSVRFAGQRHHGAVADRARPRRHEPEIPDHQRAADADALRQHPAGAAGAVVARRPAVLAHPRRAARPGHGHARTVSLAGPRRTTPRRRCRMVSSNGSKSRWRWPASRDCCCWTSRPAA